MFKVMQINGETIDGNILDLRGNVRFVRRSVTVTEDRVNAIRYWMYNRMCKVEAESSDSIYVQAI